MDASCSLRLEAGCALSLGPIWQSQDRLERSLDSAARQNSNDGLPPSRKRVREDGASEKDAPSSKASREKLRRDRLNDRFLELARELDPSASARVDKAVLLTDAAQLLVRLKAEAASLSTSNQRLQDEITHLKEEKSELRDEKARLKAERERLHMHLQSLTAPTSRNGVLHQKQTALVQKAALHSAYHTHQAPIKPEAVPLSHHHLTMWQWLPSALADASKDHILTPPVA
ncbi:hypothetical protein CLOM_g4721 [Closterium sp. NIES-68]|nr:hypothetical protein CLOM_g4721 [Closterium sp. NIES-68]GJP58000.1 hypothetical protein CLOP_g19914 [Closterium sp. NIES-67]